jgi:hypothetical protein
MLGIIRKHQASSHETAFQRKSAIFMSTPLIFMQPSHCSYISILGMMEDTMYLQILSEDGVATTNQNAEVTHFFIHTAISSGILQAC